MNNSERNKISAKRGKAGEDAVCEYLVKHDYEIVRRNYRKRCGEIDIIAKNDEWLAFVEVKTRKIGSEYIAEDGVPPSKKRRIVRTSLEFLHELYGYEQWPLPVRYDVACVTVSTDFIPQILELNYYECDFGSMGLF